MRNHQKEEIRRRRSQGEILKLNGTALNTSDQSRPTTGLPPISPSSTSSSSSVAGDKAREDKPDYFKASVRVRSGSSSSNTSR